MADYKYNTKSIEDGVMRYADNTFIPNANGNGDWTRYLTYVENGGITDPWKTEEEENEWQYQIDIQAIEDQFLIDSQRPIEVTVTEGIFTFEGGSASFINDAVTLADYKAESTVTLIDVNDEEVILSTASAKDVAIVVGTDFRTKYLKSKKDKRDKRDKKDK